MLQRQESINWLSFRSGMERLRSRLFGSSILQRCNLENTTHCPLLSSKRFGFVSIGKSNLSSSSTAAALRQTYSARNAGTGLKILKYDCPIPFIIDGREI